jgi:hypothetical protein
MEKLLGKNKEFKILKKHTEKKDTYVRYFYDCECIKCGSLRMLSQSDSNIGICLECRKQRTIDKLIGNVINIYKVLEYSHTKNKSNFYKCECLKCGEISVVKSILLNKNQNCNHCKKTGKESTKENQIKYRYDGYVYGAKKRNLSFNLTYDDFKEIVFQKCFYCGDDPKPKVYLNCIIKKTININGVDRVDSEIGYEKNNCIPSCETCNRMKMALKQNLFLEQVNKIYQNLLKK